MLSRRSEAEREHESPTSTGSSRSPRISARRTCGTRSPRGRCRRSTTSSSALGLQPGMRVLDVGCGPGRHAHELARRGIVGARHRHLARVHRARHARRARRARRSSGSTRGTMAFDAEFDAVICLCQGAFGLMTADGDDERVVGAMAAGAAAGRPAGAQRVQRLLRGEVPRRTATFDADPACQPRAHRGAQPGRRGEGGRPVDRLLHAA